jgi:two-component system, chemotaxis family, chemotaxis protein CheY
VSCARNGKLADALLCIGTMKPADVLVVDDEPDLRDTMCAILEAEGYRVETASNGREALDSLRAGSRPRLVLLDLTMPVMNGYEFLEHLKKDRELSRIPVTVVSAICDLKPPPVPCLRKPFDIEALTSVVERGLRKPSAC